MTRLNETETENYRRYHIPSCGNIHRIKVDAVFFNIGNTDRHELKKAELAWQIKKSGQHFLTEAERNLKKGEPRRRIDLVNLSTGDEIEIETDVKRTKNDGVTTIYV